jgi:hypothetical protein
MAAEGVSWDGLAGCVAEGASAIGGGADVKIASFWDVAQ